MWVIKPFKQALPQFFDHFLLVFSFLYSSLRKLNYRIFIIVLYNLGQCSFLNIKLSSNFSANPLRSQSFLKFSNRPSSSKGNPLFISKYFHHSRKLNIYRILWNTEEHKRSRRRAWNSLRHCMLRRLTYPTFCYKGSSLCFSKHNKLGGCAPHWW